VNQDGAEILSSILAKQKKEQNSTSSGDLTSLLVGLFVGSDPKNEQNFLKQMLDADGDGGIIVDVPGMLLGGVKKQSGGIGEILVGLFGK
jgi:hypothetical protein